jgi:hypothetical protein
MMNKKLISRVSIVTGVLLLSTMMVASTLILSVSAPPRKTECIGKGIYRVGVLSYDEQNDWQSVYGGIAKIDLKVTDKVHPIFGYGKLEWVIDDITEQEAKILASVSIGEPEFSTFDPSSPDILSVVFSGEADFIWGESIGRTNFVAIVDDGDPGFDLDRFRIQIGGGEPLLIGEIASYTVGEDVFIPSYDTIVLRGNVAVIGGATSYEVGVNSYSVLPGNCIVLTGENLVVDGIAAGLNVIYMDGKGNDVWITGLDGKGGDLRINGMEPIIINGGDTIVADGGYTVIRGANDSFDPLGNDLFIRGNIIIKNPPIE